LPLLRVIKAMKSARMTIAARELHRSLARIAAMMAMRTHALRIAAHKFAPKMSKPATCR